jgi:hypothetical protein
VGKIKTITGKYTKIYLKNCRGLKKGCNHQFFTQQPNKLYCSAWCRHESIREKGKNRVREYRKKYKNEGTLPKISKELGTQSKFKKKYEKPDPSYLGVPIKFFNLSLSIKDMKKETFVTTSNEGEHSPIPSLSYQGITYDDLYFLSTAYLKENNLKCPECGNRQNLVERALLVCSNPKCGLVIGAPVLHPGFTLYDLTPIRKIAPTVQDFPPLDFAKKYRKKKQPRPLEVVKEAHDNAYQKYQRETGALLEQDPQNLPENNPLNHEYWQYYEKHKIRTKILNK